MELLGIFYENLICIILLYYLVIVIVLHSLGIVPAIDYIFYRSVFSYIVLFLFMSNYRSFFLLKVNMVLFYIAAMFFFRIVFRTKDFNLKVKKNTTNVEGWLYNLCGKIGIAEKQFETEQKNAKNYYIAFKNVPHNKIAEFKKEVNTYFKVSLSDIFSIQWFVSATIMVVLTILIYFIPIIVDIWIT